MTVLLAQDGDSSCVARNDWGLFCFLERPVGQEYGRNTIVGKDIKSSFTALMHVEKTGKQGRAF